MRVLAVILGLGLAACDGAPATDDAGEATDDAGEATDDAGAVTADDAGEATADADAGEATSDAGPPEVDAGPPSDARVPMFVAYGHAARTLTSCDGGATWIAEHSFEPDGHDHSEYSGLGRMAYGDGKFVGCAGWGNPARVVWSDDGVTWEDMPDENFVHEDGTVDRPVGCSGIAWDGTQFGIIAGSAFHTSPDGRVWTRRSVTLPGRGEGDLRALGGGHGLFVFVRGPRAHLSDDGGATWYSGTGYDLACTDSVQRGGRHLVTADRVLVGGRGGTVCVSDDRGLTWRATPVTTTMRSIEWDGAEFVGIGRTGESFHSADGVTWRAVPHDAGVDLAAIAYGPGLGWVAVARDAQRFFSSPDAERWTAATSTGTDNDYLWTIVFGHARPSPACPAP